MRTWFGIAWAIAALCCHASALGQSGAPSSLAPATALGLLGVAAAAAQRYPVSPEDADISITATVRAREMRFDVVPQPSVVFTGNPERVTVWHAERENFPDPVQPGVTYHNVTVRLTILSRFADIDRIVEELLKDKQP
jgi:hypothetical protein